jgi:hypothetical protein
MKVLRVLILIFALSVFANAQKAVLSGTVQDFFGAVIPNGNIKAADDKGKTFSTQTNENGDYKLELPQGVYKIEVTFLPYSKFIISDYLITNKMRLDVALQCKGCEIVDDSIITSEKTESKQQPTAILTGTVKSGKKIVEGAVIKIRSEDNHEYFAKTNDKGVYRVILPFGKYFVYSTVNDKCWMCAEFYKHDLLINKVGEISLDIELRFMGEG